MAKQPKLTEEQLLTRIHQEIRGAIGYGGDEVSVQREEAQRYYFGEPFGNEQEGRSQYVDSSVADAVEWM